LKQGKETVVGPKEIVTMLYKHDHRLFQITFKAELADSPLGKLWEVLNPLGVLIINATMSSKDGRTGAWNVFLDSGNYALTEQALRPRLEAITLIRELRMSGGEEFVVDELLYPIVMSTTGARIMLMTKESFQSMLSAMDEMFGSGASVIAFKQGSAQGSKYASGLRTIIQGDIRKFIGELAKLYAATGMGVAEFVVMNLELPHFVVRVADSIECRGKESEKHNSQWIRGHLSGAASVALDVHMECKETRCVSVGDPYCEFELSRS
jgi:predicted hydrocarbon binding protein